MKHRTKKPEKELLEHNGYKQGDIVWFLSWDDGPWFWLSCGILDTWVKDRYGERWNVKMRNRDPIPKGCPVFWETCAREETMGRTKEEALEYALMWLKDQILERTEDHMGTHWQIPDPEAPYK